MGRFFTLVGIENKKLWKRPSTVVMSLIVIALVLLASCGMRYYQYANKADVYKAPAVADNWRDNVTKEEAALKDRIKGVEDDKNASELEKASLGSAKKTLAEDEYMLAHGISSSKPFSIWTEVADFSSKVSYGYIVAMMMMIACSMLVAGEYTEGTIKLTMSRPFSRGEILGAKLTVTIIYGLELLASALVVQTLIFMAFYGAPGIDAKQMFWTTDKIIYIPAVLNLLAVFGLDFLTAVFYTILAFALSAVTRSRSISTGFSLFMLLLGGSLAELVAIYFSWAKFFPFTTTGFSTMVTKGVQVYGTTLVTSLIATGIYAVIMCVAAFIVFIRRDV